jgi:hypothetical protein
MQKQAVSPEVFIFRKPLPLMRAYIVILTNNAVLPLANCLLELLFACFTRLYESI